MTFEQVKQQILYNIKRAELCAGYQAVRVSTDFASLLEAGASFFSWCILNKIVDDEIIDSFPDTDLNAAGIYKTSETIINPEMDIYVVRGAVVNVSVAANINRKLHVFGSSTLSIAVGENALAEVQAYQQAIVQITTNGFGSCFLEARSNVSTSVAMSEESVVHAKFYDTATATFNMIEDSYSLVRAFQNSIIDYTLDGGAIFEYKSIQQSIFNNQTVL